VLALTGSNGKTTTKEMVAAIQAAARPCLKTEGNLNNLIGLPMTLLGAQAHHQVAVVEMGMNKPGEIARYAEIAEPDAGLVLNVGPAHIGELGSIEAIADAKGELFAGLHPGAVAVANLDDPRVMGQVPRSAARLLTFGRDLGADVCLLAAAPRAEGGQDLVLRVDGAEVQAFLPLDGAHNALNAAGAVALATARPDLAPASLAAVVEGLAKVVVPGGRLAARAMAGLWVIDDGYNANRASMEAALATAAARARARGVGLVALLGEMRELGAFSEAEHARVGQVAAEVGAAAVAAFGPGAGPIAAAAAAAGVPAHHEAEDEAALYAWARERWRPGDVVLVKGSRGIRMERFLRRLEGEVD
jgi:UDP-N-acetylmuramoyl-tripeptide--D-alanyl-D-alanine ligase